MVSEQFCSPIKTYDVSVLALSSRFDGQSQAMRISLSNASFSTRSVESF